MTRKKRLIVASLIIATGLVQSACSADIGATETTDVSAPVETESPQPPSDKTTEKAGTTANKGSHEAESVIPPLGSFDRRDPDFIRYKPCLELSDEFLAKAGLHNKEMLDGIGEVDGVCSFEASPEHVDSYFNLQGSSHSFNDYQSISGEIHWDQTSSGNPILLHQSEYLRDTECLAGVETSQGTLSVSFQSFNEGKALLDPCDIAQSKLKTLLELDGKE